MSTEGYTRPLALDAEAFPVCMPDKGVGYGNAAHNI